MMKANTLNVTHTDNTQKKKHVREQLPAEKKFDQLVYGGISYGAQAGAGILLSYWLMHGKGKPYADKASNWLAKNVIQKTSKKSLGEAVKFSESFLITSTMVMMGNSFLIPVKWLEDRKPEIVSDWTEQENAKYEQHGVHITPEAKEKQQRLLAELEDQPKQTWASLAKGRIAALAAVYSTLWALGNFNDKAAKVSGDLVSGTFKATGLKKLGESKVTHAMGGIAFYDVFYSTVSAGGLYMYSHFIDPPKNKHADDRRTWVVSNLVEGNVDISEPKTALKEGWKSSGNEQRVQHDSTIAKPAGNFTEALANSQHGDNMEVAQQL